MAADSLFPFDRVFFPSFGVKTKKTIGNYQLSHMIAFKWNWFWSFNRYTLQKLYVFFFWSSFLSIFWRKNGEHHWQLSTLVYDHSSGAGFGVLIKFLMGMQGPALKKWQFDTSPCLYSKFSRDIWCGSTYGCQAVRHKLKKG